MPDKNDTVSKDRRLRPDPTTTVVSDEQIADVKRLASKQVVEIGKQVVATTVSIEAHTAAIDALTAKHAEILNRCVNMLAEARLWLQNNPQTRDVAERINATITEVTREA